MNDASEESSLTVEQGRGQKTYKDKSNNWVPLFLLQSFCIQSWPPGQWVPSNSPLEVKMNKHKNSQIQITQMTPHMSNLEVDQESIQYILDIQREYTVHFRYSNCRLWSTMPLKLISLKLSREESNSIFVICLQIITILCIFAKPLCDPLFRIPRGWVR